MPKYGPTYDIPHSRHPMIEIIRLLYTIHINVEYYTKLMEFSINPRSIYSRKISS